MINCDRRFTGWKSIFARGRGGGIGRGGGDKGSALFVWAAEWRRLLLVWSSLTMRSSSCYCWRWRLIWGEKTRTESSCCCAFDESLFTNGGEIIFSGIYWGEESEAGPSKNITLYLRSLSSRLLWRRRRRNGWKALKCWTLAYAESWEGGAYHGRERTALE